MAEIVVVVKDKVNKDFYLDCGCYKRGDVIEVREDGWPWGTIDRSNPDWRIIKVPQHSVAELAAFLAREKDTDPKNPSRTLQKRHFKLDIDNPALPQELKDLVADDSRQVEVAVNDATTAAAAQAQLPTFSLLTFKVQKPPIADPAVIGDNASIL
jgi:hypothetical protein